MRMQVISLGDARQYYLSTASVELGVTNTHQPVSLSILASAIILSNRCLSVCLCLCLPACLPARQG